ncbi:MAG: cation-transporting ATPase, partial [Methylococcus sp.]|nr:cation-transporting ATPase [Methylococcus sp.]
MNGNIKLGPNWLRVENRTLFGEGPSSTKRRFARRVFALQEVESLTIDPASGSALIRYRAEDEDAETFGERLADAVGGTCIGLDDSALPAWPTDERTELRRWSGLISCLQVIQKGPREIELRHPGFAGQGQRLARRIKEKLECEDGVERASVSIKGHVRLRLAAGADPEDLVKRAEQSLPAARGQHPLPAYRRVEFGAANLNMGLCAAGQFMFPAMIPLASGVLLATRLGTFREAGKQLALGRLGGPSFQTVVVACSVATGAPLAPALGEWP